MKNLDLIAIHDRSWFKIFILFTSLVFTFEVLSQSNTVVLKPAGKSLSEINVAWNNAGLAGNFLTSTGEGDSIGTTGLELVPVLRNGHWENVLRLQNACFGGQFTDLRVKIKVDSFKNQYGAHNITQTINRIDPGDSLFFQHLRLFTGGPNAQNKGAWGEDVKLAPKKILKFYYAGVAPSPPFYIESEYHSSSKSFKANWYDDNNNLLYGITVLDSLASGTLTNSFGVAGFFSHQPPNPGAEANPNLSGEHDGIIISRIEIESPCLSGVTIFPDVNDVTQNLMDTLGVIKTNINALLGGPCKDNKLKNAIKKVDKAIEKLGLVTSACSFKNDVRIAYQNMQDAIKSLENVGCATNSIQKDISDAGRSALSQWIVLAQERVGATDARVLAAITERNNGDAQLPDYIGALGKYQDGCQQLKSIFTGPCL